MCNSLRVTPCEEFGIDCVHLSEVVLYREGATCYTVLAYWNSLVL
jgi:hypothetical protein